MWEISHLQQRVEINPEKDIQMPNSAGNLVPFFPFSTNFLPSFFILKFTFLQLMNTTQRKWNVFTAINWSVGCLDSDLIDEHWCTGPVSFGGGGLKSLTQIFSPLLARKSSGFAQILLAFMPENGYLKNSGGGGSAAPLVPYLLCLSWWNKREVKEGGGAWEMKNDDSGC